LVPLTVDGLIFATSMVMLGSARHKVPVPALARCLLGVGIAVTLAVDGSWWAAQLDFDAGLLGT
jgi:hypothetical protein